MEDKIINGKEIAKEVKDKVKALTEGHEPTLVVVQVGDNPASSTYVKNKEKACEYCGIKVKTTQFTNECREKTLLDFIERCNLYPLIKGILVQLPLPNHINEQNVLQAISPSKDVDGFHPINVAKLWMGDKTGIVPCTPKGIMKMLEYKGINVEGKTVTVIGRSQIVGLPIAKLMMDANATVTICHSKTPQDKLERFCKEADIIVAAVGKPHFVKWCKKDAILIDVGINRTDDGIVGDIDPSLYQYAKYYTPVPGGVGPMTVACLMENTAKCANL